MLNKFPSIIKFVKSLQTLLNKAIFKYNARNKTIKEILDTNNLPKGWLN